MLRTLTAGIAIIALVVLAGAAMAGDYHYGANLISRSGWSGLMGAGRWS